MVTNKAILMFLGVLVPKMYSLKDKNKQANMDLKAEIGAKQLKR